MAEADAIAAQASSHFVDEEYAEALQKFTEVRARTHAPRLRPMANPRQRLELGRMRTLQYLSFPRG
jgi:hypothetical protein